MRLRISESTGFIGSTSGFKGLFDEVADCEMNVWLRTGREEMIWEEPDWKVAIEGTVSEFQNAW